MKEARPEALSTGSERSKPTSSKSMTARRPAARDAQRESRRDEQRELGWLLPLLPQECGRSGRCGPRVGDVAEVGGVVECAEAEPRSEVWSSAEATVAPTSAETSQAESSSGAEV